LVTVLLETPLILDFESCYYYIVKAEVEKNVGDAILYSSNIFVSRQLADVLNSVVLD
jgi:hypothetical protein